MKLFSSYKQLSMFALVFCFALYLAGCVNVDQKTKLNSDGSGTIKLEYWAKMSNLKSSTELGTFSFKEDKAKQNYTSSNSEVKSIKIEDKLDDSTKHVYMDIEFKDFNKLTSAKGFEKTKASWKEGKDGMDFNFTLNQDTSNAKSMGSDDYKLTYSFEFPGDVVTTNGRKDGKTVIWEKTLADLKTDVDMTATVKGGGGKKCGLFGMELPLTFLVGMIGIGLLNRRRNRK